MVTATEGTLLIVAPAGGGNDALATSPLLAPPWNTTRTNDIKEGQRLLRKSPTLLLVDLHGPDHQPGLDMITFAVKKSPEIPVVVTTDQRELEPEILRLGAWECLLAPLSPESVNHAIRNALERADLRQKRTASEKELKKLRKTARAAQKELRETRKADKQRTAASQLLANTLNNTSVPVACLDTQCNFMLVNSAYAAASSQDPSFFPGNSFFDLHPDPQIEKIFRRVLETGTPHFANATPFNFCRHPQHAAASWNWNLMPTKDGAGKISGLVLTLVDITGRIRRTEDQKNLARLVEVRTSDILSVNLELEKKIAELERTREELQKSKARYRRITEATSNYIYTVRVENGQPVETTHRPACEAVTGFTPEEFAHDPFLWIRMVPEEDHNLVKDQIDCILRGEVPSAIEHRIIRKDGSLRWINNTPVIHNDQEGRLLSYEGVVQDITERKLAEHKLHEAYAKLEKRVAERTAKLSRANASLKREIEDRQTAEKELTWELAINAALSETYPPLISPSSTMEDFAATVLAKAKDLTASRYGYVSTVDAQSDDCLGHASSTMPRQECNLPSDPQRPVIFPRGADGHSPALWGYALNTREPFFTNTPASHPATKDAPEGHVEILNFLSVPVTIGPSLVGHIALANKPQPYTDRDLDAVQRLAALYALAIQRKQVEEKLEKAQVAAENANVAKSQFLANMSHEIRTPMNAIIGLTDITLGTELSEEQRHYLKMVRDSAGSLLYLLNDILDFSKIEADQINLEKRPFDLQKVMQAVIQPIAMRSHQKNLELICKTHHAPACELIGDSLRLQQVLLNLVGNALKFTDKGHILVKVATLSENEKAIELHFTVSDTGIGIEPDKLEDIFDCFTQADTSVTRLYGGTGLGLAICQRLVNLMDGNIWVDSMPGQGSSFHFTARFPKGEAKAPRVMPDIGQEPRHLPVLIVDENQESLENLAEQVSAWGFPVSAAADNKQALQNLAQTTNGKQPCGLLIISESPRNSGDGTWLDSIFLQQDEHQLPLLLLTTSITYGEIQRKCQTLPACTCLTKPVTGEELQAAIFAALAADRQQPAAKDDGTTAPAVQPPTALHLLLVEDNHINRELAQIILEQAGHTVTMATDGLAALEILAKEDFDVILMDIQMPRLDGLAATRLIRECERGTPPNKTADKPAVVGRLRRRIEGKRIPIVAITAHALSSDRDRCLAAGMDQYVTKPFIPAQILSVLAEVAPASSHRETKEPAAKPSSGEQKKSAPDETNIRQTVADHLTASYHLSPEKVEDLIKSCRNSLKASLGEAEKALARQDMALLTTTAHAIKGILLNLGLMDHADLAFRLETGQKRQAEEAAQVAQLKALRQGLAPLLTEEGTGKA